jgi:hypothetical protein
MEHKSIYQRLHEFQQEELNLIKTKSAHQYKYSPLDDIVDAIKPLLKKHGMVISHTTVCLKDQSNNIVSELVRTTLINLSDTKDTIVSETRIQQGIKIGSMNPVMVIGAQITYIRRYHVVTLLGLTTEEDTDTNTTSSAKGEVSKALKDGPDYVKIFTNQIASGKDPKALIKSLENYKAKMKPEIFEMVDHLLNEALNKKK